MKIFASGLLAALLLTGCAGTQVAVRARDDPREAPSPLPTSDPSPTATPDPVPSGAPEDEPEQPADWMSPECDGDDWATAFSIVDAALGTRWLALRIVNCSDSELDLPLPGLEGFDDGDPMGLTSSIDPPPTPQPDEAVTMEMTWLSNGRCERGAQKLVVTLGDRELSPDDDCLQLGGGYAPDRKTDILVRFTAP